MNKIVVGRLDDKWALVNNFTLKQAGLYANRYIL